MQSFHLSIKAWMIFLLILSIGPAGASTVYSQTTLTNSYLPGIQKEQPTSGRFVKTNLGFMVPYAVTIPGTKTQFKMEPVPGGNFRFEIPNLSSTNKKQPPRFVNVQLKPFWIAKHEVTWREYKHFTDLNTIFKRFDDRRVRLLTESNALDAVTAPSSLYATQWRMDQFGGSSNHPAGSMTNYSARQYTKWLSGLTGEFYRLPSAVQWQYACLAGEPASNTRLSKNQLDKLKTKIWYEANSDSSRQVVGQKKPNAWGIHDMRGNACEWVLDGGTFDEAVWQKNALSDLEAISWPKSELGHLACGGDFWEKIGACRYNSFKVSTKDWWEEDPDVPASPFWTCSEAAMGVGFRVIRPLRPPATQRDREPYWQPESSAFARDIRLKIEQTGRGHRGVVDKNLPAAIEKHGRK